MPWSKLFTLMEHLNSYEKLYSQGKLEINTAEEQISANTKNVHLIMKGSESNEIRKKEWNKKQKKETINIRGAFKF